MRLSWCWLCLLAAILLTADSSKGADGVTVAQARVPEGVLLAQDLSRIAYEVDDLFPFAEYLDEEDYEKEHEGVESLMEQELGLTANLGRRNQFTGDCAQSGKVRAADGSCKKCGELATRHLAACTCGPGKYAEKDKSRSNLWTCSKCKTGRYSRRGKNSKCLPCAYGKYNDAQGSSSCKSCDDGYYAGDMASTYCRKCPVDTSVSNKNRGATECIECKEGNYIRQVVDRDNFVVTRSCDACPRGRYQQQGYIPELGIGQCLL